MYKNYLFHTLTYIYLTKKCITSKYVCNHLSLIPSSNNKHLSELFPLFLFLGLISFIFHNLKKNNKLDSVERNKIF